MVKIISFGDGFGIYQNDEEKRLSSKEFKELIEHLKFTFEGRFLYDSKLYHGYQAGYIFFVTESQLLGEIAFYFKIAC